MVVKEILQERIARLEDVLNVGNKSSRCVRVLSWNSVSLLANGLEF